MDILKKTKTKRLKLNLSRLKLTRPWYEQRIKAVMTKILETYEKEKRVDVLLYDEFINILENNISVWFILLYKSAAPTFLW